MTITFKSIIKNDADKNVIEFTAAVKESFEHGMTIYEFIEPENKIANRIEVSEKMVNIFTGPSSINLALDKLVANSYDTPAGPIYFDSLLSKVDIKKNKSKFKYTLSQSNKEFGEFEIQLTISK